MMCRALVQQRGLTTCARLLDQPILFVLSPLLDRICSDHDLKPWSEGSFDGIGDPHRVQESSDRATVCGLFHVLGSSCLNPAPVHVHFEVDGDVLRYRLRIGLNGDGWSGRSESKRRNAMYLLCREELADPPTWSAEVIGHWAVR